MNINTCETMEEIRAMEAELKENENRVWAVYWNTGEGEGGIEKVGIDYSDQEIGGVFANIMGKYTTEKEAAAKLNALYAAKHEVFREIEKNKPEESDMKDLRKKFKELLCQRTEPYHFMVMDSIFHDLTGICIPADMPSEDWHKLYMAEIGLSERQLDRLCYIEETVLNFEPKDVFREKAEILTWPCNDHRIVTAIGKII